MRRDIDKLGYKPSFTIYDADDQMNVIKQLCKSMNLDEKRFPPREIDVYKRQCANIRRCAARRWRLPFLRGSARNFFAKRVIN